LTLRLEITNPQTVVCVGLNYRDHEFE